MLERLLRTFAIVATLLVLGGWAFFAVEEARSASEATTTEIAGQRAARVPAPSPGLERQREAAHTSTREVVDDANDILLAPFAGVADQAESLWVRRSVPMLIALLVYGLGFGMLARFAAGH